MILVVLINTKVATERSEIMLERSDDYPKGEITNRVKTGGVGFNSPHYKPFIGKHCWESIK